MKNVELAKMLLTVWGTSTSNEKLVKDEIDGARMKSID